MTTTTDTPVEAEAQPAGANPPPPDEPATAMGGDGRSECRFCRAPNPNHVAGTDVWNCNTCGKTWTIEGTGAPVTAGSPVVPDQVTSPSDGPGSEVEVREPSEGDKAVIAAADAALAMPGVPGKEEFLSLAMQARILSMSGAAPKAIRDHPHIAFHVAMIGRDLGISPSSALNLIDVIGDPDKNDDVTISLSPELLVGQVKRLGLGDVKTIYVDYDRAVAVALKPGGHVEYDVDGRVTAIHGEIGRSEFTWEDAIVAGLVDERCPNYRSHWTKPGTSTTEKWKRENRCRCRQGWLTYPKRMLSWRAQGYAVADNFAEASLGLYSPEELGAVVDDQGRPIDPGDVELPTGYEPPEAPPDARTELAPEADQQAIIARVKALPPDHKKVLAERWEEKGREGRVQPLGQLTVAGLNIANALLNGAEAAARKDGWRPPEPGATDQAPDGTAEATGQGAATSEPDGASEGAEATTAPPAGVDQPALDEQPPAEPEEAATDDALERAIGVVHLMTAKEVNASLRDRRMATTGGEDNCRARLAKAIADDEVAQ